MLDFRDNQLKGGLRGKESILRARFLSVYITNDLWKISAQWISSVGRL